MYKDFKITKNDDSTVHIEGELPTTELEKHRKKSLTEIGKEVKIDGFRTGHVPEKILLGHIGEYALLQEMAEHAIREHYPAIIMEHKIDAIGRPSITLTKLALGNPLGFTIVTAVMPEITLPDYIALAKETNTKETEEIKIEDAEVTKFIESLLKERAGADKKAAGDSETAKAEVTEEIPPLTDELVKTFGDFSDVEDFKKKVREGLLEDKKRAQKEKARLALIDVLVEKTGLQLPEVIIEAETQKLLGEFKQDIGRLGMSLPEYLKTIGKTEDELKEKMRPDAEKRAKIQLIINEIALKEKLVPTQEEIDHEVEHLMQHYKDADKETASIYVTTLLTNQKVLHFLEEQKV